MDDSNNLKGSCQSPPVESSSSAESSEQKLGVVYKITNTLNGKIYVGRTKQKLEKRMAQHRHDSKKGSPGLGAAIRKYGWENFTVEVIEVCPVEQMNEREIFWIAELDCKAPKGYNLTDGGEGLVNPDPETRAKMSANHPDISGEKNPNYGKKTPPETCAKISASKTGENNPNYGKPRPPETCAKISAANKGRPSPLKGKKRSPEIIAKIKESNKRTWAQKKLEQVGDK